MALPMKLRPWDRRYDGVPVSTASEWTGDNRHVRGCVECIVQRDLVQTLTRHDCGDPTAAFKLSDNVIIRDWDYADMIAGHVYACHETTMAPHLEL